MAEDVLSLPSVLIVDDDPGVARALRKLFELAGWAAMSCGDGETALGLLAGRAFSMLVVDLWLPGTDGIALVRRIQEREPRLPVLMVTAAAIPSGSFDRAGIHVAGCFTKPFDDIRDVVRRATAILAERQLVAP